MAIWVTLKSGEVRKYNNGASWTTVDDFCRIGVSHETLAKGQLTCQIRWDAIESLEFETPCEVTWVPDVISQSIRVLLTRAKGITDRETKEKLADLARFLRGFNPQRREWVR